MGSHFYKVFRTWNPDMNTTHQVAANNFENVWQIPNLSLHQF